VQRRTISLAAWVAVLLASILFVGGSPVLPAAPSPCGWNVDRQEGLETRANFLARVSATSDSNLWAVGAHFEGGKGVPLAQTWNGSRWRLVSVPSIGTSVSGLQDVVTITPDDAWAVGHARGTIPMIQRWDGSEWRLVSPPVPGSGPTELLGVTATSPSDVWAVGKTSSGPDYRTLIERFDGTTWHVVPSPNVGLGDNVLRDVDALSPRDAWAVGWRISGRRYQTLAAHWDGNVWRAVGTRNIGTGDNFLSGVVAVSAKDVWAVGWASTGPDTSRTLIQHWDGSRWDVVDSPSPGSSANSLFGVDARSGTNAWAVGSYSDESGAFRSLVERWDGSTWQPVPSENTGPPANLLSGVATTAGSTVWAVGTRVDPGGAYRSLVERSC
jgi:hypothetical protein